MEDGDAEAADGEADDAEDKARKDEAKELRQRQQRERASAKRLQRRMRGTIFSKCTMPRELINAHRLVKTKMKQVLGRVGFLMLRDGSLEVKGNKPELNTNVVQGIIQDLESAYHVEDKYMKPDFFASFPFVDGLVSAQEMSKRGMQISCLNNRLIYPLFGSSNPVGGSGTGGASGAVFMPTGQEYLNLFSNYVTQLKDTKFSKKRCLVDLGCGSGILPIVLKENGDFQGDVIGLDHSDNALECTRMNLQIFGVQQNVLDEELRNETGAHNDILPNAQSKRQIVK